MSVGISVLMPVYNGSFFLKDTLDSLVKQTYKDFEVICIDDGSTDNSLEILNQYALDYSFIKVFTKQNEGTAAKAVNYGLKYAQGEYFMYTSQDDLFSENLLKINYLAAKKYNADAVVPKTIFYFPDAENDRGICGINGDYSRSISGNEAFSYSIDWEITGFVLWNSKLLSRIGGQFFDFSINADEYTTRLLYFYSNSVVFTEEVFYYRQNNPNSITKKWNPRLLESFATINRLEAFIQANSENKEEDLLRLWKALYHEVIRITSIFYSSRSSISQQDFQEIEGILKDIYIRRHFDLRTVTSNSMKERIRKDIVLVNYNFLKAFHFLSALIKNI